MPSLFDCLQTAIDAQMVNIPRAQRAQQEFTELRDRYLSGGMAQAMADQLAAEDVKRAARLQAQERRHQELAKLQTKRRNTQVLTADTAPADLPSALPNLIEHAAHSPHRFPAVKAVRDALAKSFHADMRGFLEAHARNIIGQVRQKALLLDVVRELHGKASMSPAAKALADAVRAVQDRARTLFNAHGGHIGELMDFGLPHVHDRERLIRAGFDRWSAEIAPRLDWSRIEDFQTGRPFAAQGSRPGAVAERRFLEDVWRSITTDGWSSREPSMRAQGASLANRRADHRLLHFRDPDDWMAYNEAFGATNPFDAIIGHIDGLARDIAMMQVLGPDPVGGLEHAIQTAMKLAQESLDPRLVKRVEAQGAKARTMLGLVTGEANRPVSEFWAKFFGTVRGVLVPAQLGSAILSSATDMVTLRNAASAVGMSPNSAMARHAQLIASSATREDAARMGWIADSLADSMAGTGRFLADVWSPQVTQALSAFVMRAQGLSFWTDMGRTAFRMEFSGHLAANAARDFASIDAPLRALLEARGITAADWDALRHPSGRYTAPTGADFVAPNWWLHHQTVLPRAEAEGLAARIGAIIEEELEHAIPSRSIEATAMLSGGRPGTFMGELARSSLMYKSYALSLTLSLIRRTAAQPTALSRVAYFAQIVAGMTLLAGLVSLPLKALVKGEDPQPMTDPSYWGKAFLQGGGVGIFGDLLTAETSRTGGGLAELLAGPVVGLAGDLSRAVQSNVARVAEGRAPLIGRDVTNLLRRNTPGTSLWHIRLALDRLVWDQMQDMLDPEAAADWARKRQTAARDRKTRLWWDRGDAAPARPPNLANALGAAP